METQNNFEKLGGLVQQLALQVARLEALIPAVVNQAETITEHGEKIASLVTWRDGHEINDAARSRRMAGWSGALGAIAMKLLDWAHAHIHLAGTFASH